MKRVIQKQPKLLFFVAVDWFFCSHFLSRAKAAQSAGYEVVVLTQVDRQYVQIESSGLRVIPLVINRRSMNPLHALLTLLKILHIYIKERPLIVHQVALKPILLGSIAARLSRVPHIINAVVGGGYAFTSTHPVARLMRPVLQLALRILINPHSSRVVFENADDLIAFVREKKVRQEDAILIRGAGVEPDFYNHAHPNGIPIVVLAARLLWDKGISEFVEAARILRKLGVTARFVVVGDVDPDNRACIDSKTLLQWREEGVVEFWGFRTDIPAILAQASIACLPSYREGLPKALLEAMAACLPCVTTNVPGCREAVRDGDNGLLVPSHNAQALAEALKILILDPELRRNMGLRGRQRVEQEFSTTLVIKKTLALYEEMLAS